MPVTPGQVATAVEAGLENVEAAADVANEIGISLYQLLALMEKESGGANVWGSDVGGTFSGFEDEVTEANYRAFRHEVVTRGMRSNGCGPLQITYRDYFPQMEERGLKPWVPLDNIQFGAALYWRYYWRARGQGFGTSNAIRWAGTWFNAGPDEAAVIPYGDRLLVLANKWRGLVGIADTQK